MTNLIEARNLVKSFSVKGGSIEVLHSVNFDIPRGSFTILFGPSGSGKSTILNTLIGLEPPTSGELSVSGTDLYSLNSDERAKFRSHFIGMVHQDNFWVNSLSVIDNVALPLFLSGHAKSKARKLAKEAVERVHLQRYLNSQPNLLSGGEQQRISVARATVKKPEVIVADEPTGNLDSSNGSEILDLLLKFNKEDNTTVVMVTHNAEFLPFSDNIISIRDGVVTQDQGKS